MSWYATSEEASGQHHAGGLPPNMVKREEYATMHGTGVNHSLAGDVGEVDLNNVFLRLCETMDAERLLFGKIVHAPTELFAVIDHAGTGAMTRGELENALERFGLGLSLHQMEAVLHAVDLDESDTIELPEFLAAFETYAPRWKPKHRHHNHKKKKEKKKKHHVTEDTGDRGQGSTHNDPDVGRSGVAVDIDLKEHAPAVDKADLDSDMGPGMAPVNENEMAEGDGQKGDGQKECEEKEGTTDPETITASIMDDSLEQERMCGAISNDPLRDPVLPDEGEIDPGEPGETDTDATDSGGKYSSRTDLGGVDSSARTEKPPSLPTLKPPSEAWNSRHGTSKDEFVCEVLFRGRGGEIEQWNELDKSVVDEWNPGSSSELAVDFNDWDTYFAWLNKVNDNKDGSQEEEANKQGTRHGTFELIQDGRFDASSPAPSSNGSADHSRSSGKPNKHAVNSSGDSKLPDDDRGASLASSLLPSSTSAAMPATAHRLKPCVHVARSGSIYVTYENQDLHHEMKEDVRTWTSRQMLASRTAQEFEFSRSQPLQTPVMGHVRSDSSYPPETKSFAQHYPTSHDIHNHPRREPPPRGTGSDEVTTSPPQDSAGAWLVPPAATDTASIMAAISQDGSTTPPPQDSAGAWLVPPATDTASISAELTRELFSSTGSATISPAENASPAASSTLEFTPHKTATIATESDSPKDKLDKEDKQEHDAEEIISDVAEQVHALLDSGIKNKTEAMHALELEHQELEHAHHLAHVHLQKDIQEKQALVLEHDRILRSPVTEETGATLAHTEAVREEKLAQLEEQIREKEAAVVEDASALQETEIAEHHLTSEMELLALDIVDTESVIAHGIEAVKSDRKLHHDIAVEAEQQVVRLEHALEADKVAKITAEKTLDEATERLLQAKEESVQADDSTTAKQTAHQKLLAAQKELVAATSTLSAIEQDQLTVAQALDDALATSVKERALEVRDDALILEAEQVAVDLKHAEDALQDEVAHNFDVEEHNRNGSDEEGDEHPSGSPTGSDSHMGGGSDSQNWRDEFEQERASYKLWMEEQKKAMKDMKKAHEAELEAGKVKVSEMQEQVALLEAKKRKEVEKALTLQDHLGELRAAKEEIRTHHNAQAAEEDRDNARLKVIEAEITFTEFELKEESAHIAAIDAAEATIEEEIHSVEDQIHDVEVAEEIASERESQLKKDTLNAIQVDADDAALEVGVVESKMKELEAVEDALKAEKDAAAEATAKEALIIANEEAVMTATTSSTNAKSSHHAPSADEDAAADAEAAARAIAAAVAKTQEKLQLAEEKDRLESERTRMRDEHEAFLAEMAREREKLRLERERETEQDGDATAPMREKGVGAERHFLAEPQTPGMERKRGNIFTPTNARVSDSPSFAMTKASPEAVLLSELQDRLMHQQESMSPEKIAASQVATSAAVVEAQKEMASMLREQTEVQNRFHLELHRTDYLAHVASLPVDAKESNSSRKKRRPRKKREKYRKRARVNNVMEKGSVVGSAYSTVDSSSHGDTPDASGDEDTRIATSSDHSRDSGDNFRNFTDAEEDEDGQDQDHGMRRRRRTRRRSKSPRRVERVAVYEQSANAGVSQAAILHAGMQARIEQLESEQLRSRLTLLEGRMSSLTAGPTHETETVSGLRSKDRRPEHVFDKVSQRGATQFLKQEDDNEKVGGAGKETRFEQAETFGIKAGTIDAHQVANSTTSSKDSHLARINARIDELDAKVLSLSPERKNPWALSEGLLREHMESLGEHVGGDSVQNTGGPGANKITEVDRVDVTAAASARPEFESDQWAESSLPAVTDHYLSQHASPRPPLQYSSPRYPQYPQQQRRPVDSTAAGLHIRRAAHSPVSVPPSEVSLPGYSIPMHDHSRAFHDHGHGQRQRPEATAQNSVLDDTWASKSVLEDIVQMRLELESSLRAGDLVRSQAQQAERVAVQETEARAMMEAADLNRSQAAALEQSSKLLKEKMGLRTQIGKVHEEVQRFMRSIQTRKSMPSHQYDVEKVEPIDRSVSSAEFSERNQSESASAVQATSYPRSLTGKEGAPSRVHVSRRGSITMEYSGVQGKAASATTDAATHPHPPQDTSGQLSGMFDTLSNKLQGMMSTASRRPDDIVVPPAAPGTSSGHIPFEGKSLRSLPTWSRAHSRESSRASSPAQTIQSELQAKFAEAARLRARASEQEKLAHAARERAAALAIRPQLPLDDMLPSTFHDFRGGVQVGGGFARGGLEKAVSSFAAFKAGEAQTTAMGGDGTASRRLGEAVSSFSVFKKGDPSRAGLDLSKQRQAKELERRRKLQFAMAELTRMNETVASRTTRF